MTAGIAVALWLVIQGIHAVQVMRGGAHASARVIETHYDLREEADGRRAGEVTLAIYEFSAHGARFGGKTEGNFLSVGDTIEIEYNPKNPAQNRAREDRKVLENYFAMLLFGGLFSYYSITLNFPVISRLFAPATPSRHETAPR
jgi:hypothetical protein